jgi:Trypsin-co-occurring domain 1
MSDKQLLKFELEDGTPFFFEVEPRKTTGAVRSGKTTDNLIENAKESFDDLLGVVEPVTRKLVNQLRTLMKDTNEVEVKFGLKLTAETGVVFAAAGGEVNFEITLKWKND